VLWLPHPEIVVGDLRGPQRREIGPLCSLRVHPRPPIDYFRSSGVAVPSVAQGGVTRAPRRRWRLRRSGTRGSLVWPTDWNCPSSSLRYVRVGPCRTAGQRSTSPERRRNQARQRTPHSLPWSEISRCHIWRRASDGMEKFPSIINTRGCGSTGRCDQRGTRWLGEAGDAGLRGFSLPWPSLTMLEIVGINNVDHVENNEGRSG
jgi:hypothetical protein